jgi:hypothetical protein
MKYILSLIISGALVVSGFGQTRNVLVGTNNAVVQPTNFWSADASNARTGLGLGTAATNPATAFQSSSSALSNLATSNGGSLTNLQATNLVGIIPASNISTVTFTNIGTIAISNGGTGATNAINARQNLGSTIVGDAVFIATNAAAARTAIGALSTNGSAAGLTDFVGTTNPATARTSLGLGSTNGVTFQTIYAQQTASSGIYSLALGQSNTGFRGIGAGPSDFGYYREGISVWFATTSGLTFSVPVIFGTNAATTRTNLGLGWSALTNTSADNFRSAINLGTNSSPSFVGLIITNSIIGSQFTVINPFSVINSDGTNSVSLTPTGIFFSNVSSATTRTNLGLGAAWLTNTDAPVFVNTNGEVVSPTNFWAAAPISTTVQYQTNITGTSTNAATNSRNLFLFSLSPSVSGITNTVTLPTNPATTFEGDRATIIHLAQSTNAVTAIRQLGAATNLITLNQLDETVLLMYRSGAWILADNISYIEPIYFSGTNAAANAAASRTNLGLAPFTSDGYAQLRNEAGDVILQVEDGVTIYREIYFEGTNASANAAETRTNLGIPLPALTNTNVTNFRSAIGLGTTNTVTFSNVVILGNVSTTNVISTATNFNVGGTLNVTNKAETRTNLGLGLPALTNTDNANFRDAIELGATNNVSFSNVTASGTLTATGTVTATTNLVVDGFVDFTTNRTNNTPTNTPNFAAHFAWIEVKIGTNSVFIPVYK